jgi:hypothetical protein
MNKKVLDEAIKKMVKKEMLKEGNYEQTELDKLNYSSKFPMKVLFVDGDGKKTNFLSITPSSIPIIIKFLKEISDFVPDPDWKGPKNK